jgi:hypothetical protein
MKVEVTGGGPGSQTTGLNVTTTTGEHISIAQKTADQTLKKEAEKAIALLTEIKSLLQAPKIDKPGVLSRLSTLARPMPRPC